MMSEPRRQAHAQSSPHSDLEIYGWRLDDRAVSIRMPIAVLERLQSEISHRLETNKGDIAGVLIGRTISEKGLVITVDDYQVVANTQWIQRDDARRLVGLFRSQRYGRPMVDTEDFEGAARLFPLTQNIFLLIRSAAEDEFMGMFFLRQAGAAKIEAEYAEIPFNADILKGRSAISGPRLAPPPPSPAPADEAPESPPEPMPVKTERTPPPPGRSWRSWLSIAATWTAAVSITMLCMDGRSVFSHHQPPVVSPLSLQVDRSGGLLEIAWDRTAGVAMNSQGGFMTFRDGNQLKKVRLDPSEVRTGHIYYQSQSADLGIRLEVTQKDGGTASESIRVVGLK